MTAASFTVPVGRFTDDSVQACVTALRDDFERRLGREGARRALAALVVLIELSPKADLTELLMIARDELAEKEAL